MGHNVGAVINDIDDVQDDLRSEMDKRVGKQMDILKAIVKKYVIKDPNYSTKLLRNIDNDTDIGAEKLSFSVFVDTNIVEYAAIVEYGSGRNSNRTSKKLDGNSVPTAWPDEGSETPPNYPFDSPDIDYNYQNPYDMGNYDEFGGFVDAIYEWIGKKPIEPLFSRYISAVLIAKAIVDNGNYAHPYLRPAWFDHKNFVVRAAKNAVTNATR